MFYFCFLGKGYDHVIQLNDEKNFLEVVVLWCKSFRKFCEIHFWTRFSNALKQALLVLPGASASFLWIQYFSPNAVRPRSSHIVLLQLHAQKLKLKITNKPVRQKTQMEVNHIEKQVRFVFSLLLYFGWEEIMFAFPVKW